MRCLVPLALSFTLTACAQAIISSPGRSDDAIRADMNSCDAGSLTLHNRSVIDCLNIHGDTITYADGRIPPFTFSNPYDIPMTAYEVQQRNAAANVVLERWKATARENDQAAIVSAQSTQQNPDGTSVAPPQSYLRSQPQRVSQDDPMTVEPHAPAGTNSQLASTVSAASADTPNQDKSGWIERVATASRNLVSRFQEYERGIDHVHTASDEAPLETNFESHSVIIITALDSDLKINNIVVDKGNCNPFYAEYHFGEYNYHGNPNPYHLFQSAMFQYGDKLRILAFDRTVTEQALDYSDKSRDGLLGATLLGQHDCTIYEMEIDTNRGNWSYRFHQ